MKQEIGKNIITSSLNYSVLKSAYMKVASCLKYSGALHVCDVDANCTTSHC